MELLHPLAALRKEATDAPGLATEGLEAGLLAPVLLPPEASRGRLVRRGGWCYLGSGAHRDAASVLGDVGVWLGEGDEHR